MPLVFGDDRFDFGEFEDLVTQRIRIVARERLSAAPTM